MNNKLNIAFANERNMLLQKHNKIMNALFFEKGVDYAEMCKALSLARPYFDNDNDFSEFVQEKLKDYFAKDCSVEFIGDKVRVSLLDEETGICKVYTEFGLNYPFICSYHTNNNENCTEAEFARLARQLLFLAKGKKVVISIAYCSFSGAYDLLVAEGCSIA